MPQIRAAMMALHFDHCISRLKGTSRAGFDYLPNLYWYQQPMVLEFEVEKLSGCFVHAAVTTTNTGAIERLIGRVGPVLCHSV
jgi:hypothetical protein